MYVLDDYLQILHSSKHSDSWVVTTRSTVDGGGWVAVRSAIVLYKVEIQPMIDTKTMYSRLHIQHIIFDCAIFLRQFSCVSLHGAYWDLDVS